MKRNRGKLSALIFDLDDTLYPEYSFVMSGFSAVAAWIEQKLNLRKDEVFWEFKHLYDKGFRGNTFNHWVAQHNQREELVPQMVEIYRSHSPTISPYPGVVGTLQKLRQSFRLGLLSDGSSVVQQRKLTALGLAPFFDLIIYTDELGKEARKPSTQPFLYVLQALGLKGYQAVYIGDNPLKDFLGARMLGMWTIRIRWPDGLHKDLEPPSPEYSPHLEIRTIDELYLVILQIEHFATHSK
jgi:putative hydrolase of the HAD superfamily